MAPATTTSVQVALRIRPITQQDTVSIPSRFQRVVIHDTSDTSVAVDAVAAAHGGAAPASSASAAPPTTANKKQAFTFDYVHNSESSQHAIYTSTAEPLIARFLEGFNCTILAYGQTSSGKTHTMTGLDLDGDPSDRSNGMGIIPRSIAEIFSRVQDMKKERRGAWNATVKASFIEIYNEDLIDLLSTDDLSIRREVQIREDKEGHIIWGGLREVPVKNVAEVMSLIRQGTSIRRTNETQMNAQSSRSHAIFSLTLTQKRFTGTGTPPGGVLPSTPSRLTRPGSGIGVPSGRVGSPTFGRPPTPSFQSAITRAQQNASRPHSSLGHSEDDRHASASSSGEWSTIVSKFHFVDLAGSERLKRTAAVGERIKEGISINSGLLALGNVISALGDPSKSKTTTHVPYRDSKLTRLLQDSLGGNAHTLMIACVSPVEWNVGETINTLKYANRARNIRNRVRIEEREEGWEDIEWLRNTVIKLRKELKVLREGGTVSHTDLNDLPPDDSNVTGAAKQVRVQLAELQSQYVELRQRFTERTEELTRLRREVGENIRRSGGSMGAGTGRYEEIVGPVIEEYEKTISAMEAELALNRAALRHTNDLLTEKEEELAAEAEQVTVMEGYVEEMQSKVTRMAERETSTEAYIQDLEEKIRNMSVSSDTTSEALGSLQKEISKYKDVDSTNAGYILELERRLAKSEEIAHELRIATEKAGSLVETREGEIKELQQKLAYMRGDEQGWRFDLEAREDKLRAVEAELQQWQGKGVPFTSQKDKHGLEIPDGTETPTSKSDLSVNGDTPIVVNGSISEAQLEDKLRLLQEQHSATVAQLTDVSTKYREALHEISDLAAQLKEYQLQESSVRATAPDVAVDGEIPVTTKRRPSASRKASEDLTGTSPVAAAKRNFFKAAASTDSLRARSPSQSLSLSQELSLARSPQRSISPPTLRHQRSESLLNNSSRPTNIAIPASPSLGQSDRSPVSLQKEIMRLQDVLKEREEEINQLENALQEVNVSSAARNLQYDATPGLSPNTMEQLSALRTSIIHEVPDDEEAGDESKRTSLGRLDELMLSMAQKESQHREQVEDLTTQLKHVRRQFDDLTTLSRDQALNMSGEMESLRREQEETLVEVTAFKEQNSVLKESIELTEATHKEQLAALRNELQQKEQALETSTRSLKSQIEAFRAEISGLHQTIEDAETNFTAAQLNHESSVSMLKETHAAEQLKLKSNFESEKAQIISDHQQEISKLRSDYEGQLQNLRDKFKEDLHRNDEEYYTALSKFRTQHEEEIKREQALAAENLQRLREDMEAKVRQAELGRQAAISENEANQSDHMTRLQEEHESVLLRKAEEFALDLQRAKDDRLSAIERQKTEHDDEFKKLQASHKSTMQEASDNFNKELSSLRVALQKAENEREQAISRLKAELQENTAAAQAEKTSAIESLKAVNGSELGRLQVKHKQELERAAREKDTALEELERVHASATAQLIAQHRDAITVLHASLDDRESEHRATVETLIAEQSARNAEASAREEQTRRDLEDARRREKEVWDKDHTLLLEDIATLKAAVVESDNTLEDLRRLHETKLSKHSEEHASLTTELQSSKAQIDNSSKQLVGLREELERLRNANSQLTVKIEKQEVELSDLMHLKSEHAEAQASLQKARDAFESLSAEKARLEGQLRDLQSTTPTSAMSNLSSRPMAERTISFPRNANGLPPAKLPPLSPPPSIPPPPLPHALNSLSSDASHGSISTVSTHGRQSSGSQDTHESSMTPTTSVNGTIGEDKIQAQARLMEEQEAMIKTLNKQLAHCEGDLQAHVDLVGTLETSLNDSERNLRKARNQANELTRERDSLLKQLETARNEARDSQRELVNARQSVIEQKQSLESRLDEERRAKERTRAQLDARMEELQRRKSKFACM